MANFKTKAKILVYNTMFTLPGGERKMSPSSVWKTVPCVLRFSLWGFHSSRRRVKRLKEREWRTTSFSEAFHSSRRRVESGEPRENQNSNNSKNQGFPDSSRGRVPLTPLLEISERISRNSLYTLHYSLRSPYPLLSLSFSSTRMEIFKTKATNLFYNTVFSLPGCEGKCSFQKYGNIVPCVCMSCAIVQSSLRG